MKLGMKVDPASLINPIDYLGLMIAVTKHQVPRE